MSLIRRLRAYPAHDNPRVAACNAIALVVASNQPVYPLYLHWFVGGDAWVGCITLLSTPFFLAVPWVARRSSIGGRMLLPIAGIGNTIVSTWAFGEASGVELFLMPCAMIAGMAFGRSERIAMLVPIGLALAAFMLLHGHHGAPIGHFDTADYARFLRLNAYSVATLTALVAWRFGGREAG